MSNAQSAGWRFRNSLWIGWALFLSLGWIGFFIIGIRTRKKLWIAFGAAYFILWLLPYFFLDYTQDDFALQAVGVGIILFQWIPQLVHLCLCRKPYLARRAILLENRDALAKANKRQVQGTLAEEAGLDHAEKMQFESELLYQETVLQTGAAPDMQRKAPCNDTAVPLEKIDLNKCTEDDLNGLPGVGVARAKRAIACREASGFSSVSDFCERLGIAPHFAAQLQSLAKVADTNKRDLEHIEPEGSRTIDV